MRDAGLDVGGVEVHIRLAMWSSDRDRNSTISPSIHAQIRDTVDFDIPEPQPNARTRSSTFRVDVPVMWAVMITAHRARSTRRRGSNKLG